MRLCAERGGLVLDGATGTMVQDLGFDVQNRLWSSAALLSREGRSLTFQVHRSYAEAGADLLTANTHNASLAAAARFLAARPRSPWPASVRRWGPMDPPFDDEGEGAEALSSPGAAPPAARRLMEWINKAALRVARAAARGRLVAACLASPDRPYARAAGLTSAQVEAALAPQFEALLRLRPDLVLFEMCTTEADLDGVARLLARTPDRPPVGVGVVVGGSGRLLGGPSPADAAAAVPKAEAFFVQCTRWDLIEPAVAELVAAVPPRVVVGAYGNDGRRFEGGAWVGERVTPATYAEAATRWRERGAKVVGGCCGTTPEHIAALSASLSRPVGFPS